MSPLRTRSRGMVTHRRRGSTTRQFFLTSTEFPTVNRSLAQSSTTLSHLFQSRRTPSSREHNTGPVQAAIDFYRFGKTRAFQQTSDSQPTTPSNLYGGVDMFTSTPADFTSARAF